MKRITLLLVGLLSLPFFSYSGGIVTNQNQSAAYIRMFARDASTDIDAVFFNPAGLTKLEDGFHLGLNYQYIKQNKLVTSNYQYLSTMPESPTEYEGDVNVPIFPSVYAAYKTGKWVFSFGWNPVGGGGGAIFDNGLPSFETGVSDLVPGLTAAGLNTTDYSLDAYFEGTSVFWGYQFGISYEINDMFSVYAGGRYVTATNTYSGHLTDVMVNSTHPVHNPSSGMISASELFTNLAADATTGATTLQGISDDGAGSLTPYFLYSNGLMTEAQYGSIAAVYQSRGLDPTTNTVDQGIPEFTALAQENSVKALLLADQEDVEVEQTGSGFAPIIGVYISPNEKLSFGLKYEFKTELELENNTTTDFIVGYDVASGTTVGMFPDGAKTRNDIPALLSAGLDYNITDKLSVSSGFHMYFDKSADYGRTLNGESVDNDEVIDRNSTEFALGIEYMFTDKLLLSIGYLNTQTGVTEDYQTDLSWSQHSNTVGLGGKYAISSGIDINVGLGYTMYNDARKIYNVSNSLGQTLTTTEGYDKDNLFLSLGLNFNFWGKKAE